MYCNYSPKREARQRVDLKGGWGVNGVGACSASGCSRKLGHPERARARGPLFWGRNRSRCQREALDGAVALPHDDGAPRKQPALPFLTESDLQIVEVAEPVEIALVREVVLVRDVGLET